jgi:hypothetical protein
MRLMRTTLWRGLIALGVGACIGGSRPAAALTVTFDGGPTGLLASYTENGITVAPVLGFHVVDVGDHDANASNDLLNRPVCCSTPYEFTFSGGVFSVAKFDFVLNAGPHVFTSSAGAMVTPGASGTVVLPAAGWTGITNFRWDANGSNSSTDTALMDNLKFCPSDCNDGNPCTDDACDPDSGGADVNGCTHTNNTAPCTDGTVCTQGDVCAGGACIPGPSLNCDDGIQCTLDSCDPMNGCQNNAAALDGQPCDDGNTCSGPDTCSAGVCSGPTLPQNCDDNDPCTEDLCDPMGGCLHPTAGRDGFGCDDNNPCTTQDVCSGGICSGQFTQADTDGDGYCDIVENTAGCNSNDGAEIPPQSGTFAGAPGKGSGEVILTYSAPSVSKVTVSTDPSCATAGTCGPIGFCTAGKIGDPCINDAACNQPPSTCRVLVNYANVSDLLLIRARVNNVNFNGFLPTSRGCSRKVDIPINPAKAFSKLQLKCAGNANGRIRRDSDKFRFLNF